MSPLKSYRQKRRFDETPEPKAKKSISKQSRFCVQKHQARRLHYDLRLELDGVLVSFAVPKLPSMDPKIKRLAIHVEDHPVDYIDFEGVIPKGNYGAGTVEIWDQGNYQADKKALRAGLKKGHISFYLMGEKLIGTFALIKLKSDGDEWLLFKIKDELAEKHALMGVKRAMPSWIDPMLATLVDEPFSSKEWIYEIKWDGFRSLAFVNNQRIALRSRNQNSFNKMFATIVKELKKFGRRAIFDGEIVALDDQGISRFELLQRHEENAHLIHYMIFDLLYLDGRDLRGLPISERKILLQECLLAHPSDLLHFGDHVEDQGIDLFKAAQKKGLEGLIAKKKDSLYVSGRSYDWVKIKTHERQEFVVVGFSAPQGQRKFFGSLVLALYDGDELRYCGHVGTGFSDRVLTDVYKKMKPLMQKISPLAHKPKDLRTITWLKPKLVAEISYAEKTSQGLLRQPVFHGLRSDKDAHQIIDEHAQIPSEEMPTKSNVGKIFWPQEGYTKGDMLAYYETIAPYMLPHLKGRPLMLRRFPDGINGLEFYQKNLDRGPSWLKTMAIEHSSPRGKKIDHYAVVEDLRSLLYLVNLAAIELHPMLTNMHKPNQPDFLVIDLDRQALPFKKVVEVALSAHDFFDEIGLPNYCKTSGGQGLHIYIPLNNQLNSEQSLRLAELLACFIRDRLPSLVSLERSPGKRQRKVYVDYLQNVKLKSMVAPYSLRARAHAPVSTPLFWKEVTVNLDPKDYNIVSVPKRLKKIGDIFAPVLDKGLDIIKIIDQLEKNL